MGLIRKLTSVSTLGGVKYTSKREAQTKLALEQAKLLREERKALKGAAKPGSVAGAAGPDEKWEAVVAAIEAGEASLSDLSRMQRLSMPISYQIRCKAAERRRGLGSRP